MSDYSRRRLLDYPLFPEITLEEGGFEVPPDAKLINFQRNGMEYTITKSPSLINVEIIQKDGATSEANSKVHIERDLNQELNWCGVGPSNDKTKGNKKIYSKLDVFIKRLEPTLTITKLDQLIANGLELKTSMTWITPTLGEKIDVITQKEPVRLPLIANEEFVPIRALLRGIQLNNFGNENYRLYKRRYETLIEGINVNRDLQRRMAKIEHRTRKDKKRQEESIDELLERYKDVYKPLVTSEQFTIPSIYEPRKNSYLEKLKLGKQAQTDKVMGEDVFGYFGKKKRKPFGEGRHDDDDDIVGAIAKGKYPPGDPFGERAPKKPEIKTEKSRNY